MKTIILSVFVIGIFACQSAKKTLDLRGRIPTFLRITPAQVHDVHVLDHLIPEPGAFYVMDRGDLDFGRLYRWTQHGAFFVTRARKNFRFHRLASHPVETHTGVQCDQTVSLVWFYSARGYPAPLRRIRFRDVERDQRFVFLTNNFVLPAHVIADLYRRRWQIELFFKWIKQHLRIKAFFGTSENAVKSQIWIAVSVYVPILASSNPATSLKFIVIIVSLSYTCAFDLPILNI